MKSVFSMIVAVAWCLLLGYLISCKRADTIKETKPLKTATAAADAVSGESIFQLASTWHTEEGKAIQLGELKGKVLVMVMIYTSCKAACPRLVADMLAIREQIPEELTDKVQYVLVSIDPENDTPERLKQFAISKNMDLDLRSELFQD